jgi:chromosome partitioning protein
MIKIAIATHKGGSGKTVTSINLSAGLAKKNKVLLVDLDPQGHSSLGLGVAVGLDEPTIADLLQDPRLSPKNAIRRVTDTLNLLPSNIRLARVGESLYAGVRREERLNLALKSLVGYDYMLMDCPPSLGTLTANALACADWILVPCEMGARAADGLMDLLELVSLLKGENFTRWRILLTKFDARKTVTNEVVLKALDPHKDKILTTRIGVSESLNQCQMAGQDIFHFEPDGRGASFYADLTQEILAITKPKQPIEAI